MQALAIVGYKKSGKTTLLYELAKKLTDRGRKVAVAKTSHCGLDKSGTDTQKLLQVSRAVAGLAPGETALFWPRRKELLDLLPLLDADILLLEGGKSMGWLPRVLLLKDPAEAVELGQGLALASYGTVRAPGLPALEDVSALADLVESRGFTLAGLNCEACGREDCAGLARDIVAGLASPEDCAARASKLEITVDGQKLALGPFVERLLGAGFRGLLSELKGHKPGGKVEIRLEG